MLQNAFAIAITIVPTWEEAHEYFAAFDPEGEEGVLSAVGVLDTVVGRIEAALRARHLWDDRRI